MDLRGLGLRELASLVRDDITQSRAHIFVDNRIIDFSYLIID